MANAGDTLKFESVVVMVFCFFMSKKMFAYKVKHAACYPQVCFFHILHYVIMLCFFFLKFIKRTTAVMLAADCCAS